MYQLLRERTLPQGPWPGEWTKTNRLQWILAQRPLLSQCWSGSGTGCLRCRVRFSRCNSALRLQRHDASEFGPVKRPRSPDLGMALILIPTNSGPCAGRAGGPDPAASYM
jgi:hypothetical protein